jgi:hypothetical protein
VRDWKSDFDQSWLSWPKFDYQDHRFCPVLDGQASGEGRGADFGVETQHLPFVRVEEEELHMGKVTGWIRTSDAESASQMELVPITLWEYQP